MSEHSGEYGLSEAEACERVNVLLVEGRMYQIPAVAEAVEDFESGQASAVETLAALTAFIDNPPAAHLGRDTSTDG